MKMEKDLLPVGREISGIVLEGKLVQLSCECMEQESRSDNPEQIVFACYTFNSRN